MTTKRKSEEMAATRASKSRQSPSSTETPASPSPPTRKLVFRVKSAGNSKREGAEEEREEGDVKRPETTSLKKKKKKKTSLSRKRVKVDDKKPKKPPTAFFFFLEDFRKTYQDQNPHVKSMRDVGKACGEKWKTMTYEEKVHYYDIATEKRAEFDQAMAKYLKRKESGEDQESPGSESEFDD